MTGHEYMTLAEVMAFLRCSRETVRRYVKAGKLKAYRIAGRRAMRFHPEDVARLLEPVDETPTESKQRHAAVDQEDLFRRISELRDRMGYWGNR